MKKLLSLLFAFMLVFGSIGNIALAQEDIAAMNEAMKKTYSEAMNDASKLLDMMKQGNAYTLESLSIFNGEKGYQALVAVDGFVYDVSSAWEGSEHNGVKAGSDATDAIKNAPHAEAVLNKLKLVGFLLTEEMLSKFEKQEEWFAQLKMGRVFTLEALKMYNGADGMPAYVAVNGVVYDVSNVPAWKNGMHNGVSAGMDASVAIQKAPHAEKVLAKLPAIGFLLAEEMK